MRLIDPARPQLAIEAVDATGFWATFRGLLGWRGLEPGRGMLLRGKQVHTIGMSFTIDAVYLSGGGRVLRVETLVPGRIGPWLWSAKWVLELSEGEAERLGIVPEAALRPQG